MEHEEHIYPNVWTRLIRSRMTEETNGNAFPRDILRTMINWYEEDITDCVFRILLDSKPNEGATFFDFKKELRARRLTELADTLRLAETLDNLEETGAIERLAMSPPRYFFRPMGIEVLRIRTIIDEQVFPRVRSLPGGGDTDFGDLYQKCLTDLREYTE